MSDGNFVWVSLLFGLSAVQRWKMRLSEGNNYVRVDMLPIWLPV
jgi:hypothetical protein